ncbi:hypothetical protein C4D60_Mb11t04520 [Musa balbisiana]|uniref:Dipeptidylpeptidase IV N-terminal domain-containing protein n=1 Tax=Musa balbisiana TaxID=52838 RepID=A0A4S8J1Q4_MUSBA|nr:hypothetical protein C4D60_Mb11t04520 [Musa balbisiana]
MEPQGTIVFTTVGLPHYGFDVFSVTVSPDLDDPAAQLTERRRTDGTSVNFNAQFVDEGDSIAFVSERTGSARLFRSSSRDRAPVPLPAFSDSLFHDRPTVRNGRVFFVSAHERPSEPFRSWCAVYSARLDSGETARLTPPGFADMSPAVSRSGELVAVASYGSAPWKGDFHELATEVVVFRASDPSRRSVICSGGGWPAWAGESTLFFHRKANDGWWSIFRSDLTAELENAGGPDAARRITPAGLHAFTPAAAHDGKRIAVATRRKGSSYRQIEIFDLESDKFLPVTERINPSLHHYNPFFSPDSGHLGYHRFRGEFAPGDSIVPHLQPVRSPVSGLRMQRLHGTFPSFSPGGRFITMNGDFLTSPGLMVIRSDGFKRWTLLKEPSAFYTAWSPTENGVIFTSIGPIFDSAKATVQIARVTFDPADLDGGRDEEVKTEMKVLTRADAGNNAFAACSPDGRYLVFRSGRSGHKNLYIVDAVEGETSGGGVRRLTEGEWIDTMPVWSPDGELIAFSSNRHDPSNPDVFGIYLVRPDGTGLRRVHVAGPPGSAEVGRERLNHVCFSPDSRWLVFTANLGAVTAEPVSLPNHFQPYGDLYACRLDGTGLTRLTYNGYENGTPTWYSAGDVPSLGSLSLGPHVGEKLRGQFDEPLWITCDV